MPNTCSRCTKMGLHERGRRAGVFGALGMASANGLLRQTTRHLCIANTKGHCHRVAGSFADASCRGNGVIGAKHARPTMMGENSLPDGAKYTVLGETPKGGNTLVWLLERSFWPMTLSWGVQRQQAGWETAVASATHSLRDFVATVLRTQIQCRCDGVGWVWRGCKSGVGGQGLCCLLGRVWQDVSGV